MVKNIHSDNLLFVLSKTDNENEYEFYYKDKNSLNEAFDAICQIIRDIEAEDNKGSLPTTTKQ